MYLKKIIILLFFLFIELSFADLTGFAQNIQREKLHATTNSSVSYRATNSQTTNKVFMDSCITSLFDFIFRVTSTLWLAHNGSVSYGSYPFGNSSFFSMLGTSSKSYYYEVLSGYHNYGNEGQGFYVGFYGKVFKFFGPQFDYMNIDDKKTYLNFFSAGLNFAIFQWDYFAPDFYAQFITLRGVLREQGVSMGMYSRFFVWRPIAFSVKSGVQIYNDFSFLDLVVQLHFHIKKIAFHIGYSLLTAEYDELEGWQMGSEFWF